MCFRTMRGSHNKLPTQGDNDKPWTIIKTTCNVKSHQNSKTNKDIEEIKTSEPCQATAAYLYSNNGNHVSAYFILY